MAGQSNPVSKLRRFKPGHLITDQDLNLFVDAIKSLDKRLAVVETALRRLGKK